jgi:hypothetical protein
LEAEGEAPAEGVPESLPSARADFYGGLAWIAFGAAVGIASWRMDRLEKMGVSFFTAPGLVPGVLGVLMAACGIVLAVRSVQRGAFSAALGPPMLLHADLLRRIGVTLVLCLGFSVGLVTRVPFWIAAAIFLFLQIAVLQYPERTANNEVARGLVVAAVIAVIAAGVIAFVFEKIFLVRLP